MDVRQPRALAALAAALAALAFLGPVRDGSAAPRTTVRMRHLEQAARVTGPRVPIARGITRGAPDAQDVQGARDAGPDAACPAFVEPDRYATAGYVFATVIADFDGDGRPDVAAAIVGDSVRIFATRGGGRLGPGRALPVADADRLAAADLDGDGRPDLVAGGSEGFTVLRNTASGFVPTSHRARLPLGAGITIADMDRDGHLDLVVPGDDSLAVHRNDGHGAFARAWHVGVPVGTRQVAVADLDRDGSPDVVVGAVVSGAPVLAVLLQRAGGTFERRDLAATDGPFALADLDADGVLDLVEAPSGDSIAFRRGLGGGFAPAVPAGPAIEAQSLAVADLDGDGRADLLGWSPVPGAPLTVLRGTGDGRVTRLDGYALGGQVRGVSAGDLDGDRLPDVVAGDGEGRLVVARGRGAARLAARGQQSAGDFASGVTAADLDGDGVADLATVTYWASEVRLFRGRGDGTFDPPRRMPNPVFPIAVATADLTRDGRPDLLTLSADDPADVLAVHLNRGGGTFAPGPAWNLRRLGTVPEALATADLDRDGAPDVVVAGAPGAVLMRGGGEDLLVAPVTLPSGACDLVATGDLDADGWTDVVVAGEQGRLWVLLNDGSGGFPDSVGYDCPDPSGLAIADLDGDGRDDLAVGDWNRPRVRVFLTTPGGALRRAPDATLASALPSTVVAVPPRPGAAADLVVAAYDAGDQAASPLALLRNDGNGGFAEACGSRLGPAANGAAVADLDGDGALDLAVSHGHPDRRQEYVTVALRPGPDPRATRTVALARSGAEPGRVRLAWRPDGAVDVATVWRRAGAGPWIRRAALRPDADGVLALEDSAGVGERVGYRLALAWAPAPVVTGETWVEVPTWPLSLSPVRPNPVRGGDARLSVLLSGRGPARLDLLDVAGRVVRSRALDGLAPGPHELALGLDAPLAPGLYLVRLTESGRSATTRVVLAR